MSPGPFLLPMTDRQAFSLETRLKALPRDFEPRRLSLAAAPAPQPEGRSDISWITTETPDRQGDIVLAAGMDDSHFRLNPIVTLNHDYSRPPVGRSLWRKLTSENGRVGVKAKTYYPPRPADWSAGPWLPDLAYGLLQAGLLNAKSIGFLPLKVRSPTSEEVRANPQFASVRAIIERWLLLEYACCYLPMQPEAVVEESAAAVGRQLQHSLRPLTPQLLSPIASVRGPSGASPITDVIAFLGSPSSTPLITEHLQRTYQKHIGLV